MDPDRDRQDERNVGEELAVVHAHPHTQPKSNRAPSAAGVTENSGSTSLTAASTAASSAASSRPGSWWNGTKCFTPASRANASASWIVLCPQPTWRGYSSRVYCAS